LLTFSGEARILARSGGNPRESEGILRQILEAIENLDRAPQKALYKTSEPGFFVRDWVTDDKLSHATQPGPSRPNLGPASSRLPSLIYSINSDFKGDKTKPGQDAPSIDQYVSLFMGWWAVAHWSTDRGNVALARSQTDRAIDYLMRERFMMDFPGTNNIVPGGGGDARPAAGFLCKIAGETTGRGSDYFLHGKVRIPDNNNKCRTCAGSGLIRAPNPNLQCPACHGSGHFKVVVGGGKCLACNGSGEMKIVVGGECPVCQGSGKMKVVWTDFFGHDHTSYSSNCSACGGSGHLGSTTKLGKCKFCHGSGHLAQTTNDFGRCKLCGDSGRWKGTLPRIKCPVCGGTGEWNLYVRDVYPILLALEPLGLVAMAAPHIQMEKNGLKKLAQGTMPKITIDYNISHVVKAYVRNLMLICMAHETSLLDTPKLWIAARESNHPWSIALRAARMETLLPGMAGRLVGDSTVAPAFSQLVQAHRSCPPDGPSDDSPAYEWSMSNRWERCTDVIQSPQVRSNAGNQYNGLDFLSLEVLMRISGHGKELRD